MVKANNKIKTYSILGALILFHLINVFIWLKIDQAYLSLDAWSYYRYSLEVINSLKNLLHGQLFLSALEPQKWHGILVEFITAPFYFIFGSAQDTAVMIAISIFLPILIFSVYGIGKKLCSRKTGILAAFIVTMYPLILNHTRLYMLDLPLTSMVALSIYYLLASENFTQKKYTLLFGLSFGLGLLVKFNYLAFIAGPFIVTSFRLLSQKKITPRHNNRRKKYLALSLLIAFILCGSFYVLKGKEIFHRIFDIIVAVFKDVTVLGFFAGRFTLLLEYFTATVNHSLSFLLFIIFLVGFRLFHKQTVKERWLLYLPVIIPSLLQLLILSVPADLMLRYAMPSLPMIALITAIGLGRIRKVIARRTMMSVLIILSLLQFFAVSYGIPLLPEKLSLPFSKKNPEFEIVFFQQKISISPFLNDKTSQPSRKNWQGEKLYRKIIQTNPSQERIKVLLLGNIPQAYETLSYYALKNKDLMDIFTASMITEEEFYLNRFVALDEICLDADFVIVANNTASAGEKFLLSQPAWKEKIEKTRKIFSSAIDRFHQIVLFTLPDRSTFSLYQNTFKKAHSEHATLRDGNLKFLFDNGRNRIFWKNIEITKGLGLYTSLFSLQHWRDSMEAVWKITKKTKTYLKAEGRWMFIPVSQIWEIKLDDENTIRWQVRMIVHDTIKIEKEDAKLMISNFYKNWRAGNSAAETFSDEFLKERWNTLWSGSSKNTLGVEKVDEGKLLLPTVRFTIDEELKGRSASIENSDQLFDSHVIGYSKRNDASKKLYSPRDYPYFSATIFIEE